MKLSQANQLLESLKTIEVKDLAFDIARNIRILQNELTEYNQFKQEIFRKYGEEKDGVLSVNPMASNFEEFRKEIALIEDKECDFNFYLFSEEELRNCKELTTSQQLFLQTYFMKGEENDNTKL